MARRRSRRQRKQTNHKSNIQLTCERLEARQLLAGDLFYSLSAMALPGPGSLPADTSGFGGDPATEMAEVASMDDFSNRADGMGDRASAPEAGKNNAAAGQAAHADIQAANLASLLSGNTSSSRGLQTPADEGWGQLQGKLTGTEHGISNPADRYAHLTDPVAGYSTEGSNGYGHGEDDLFAGDGLDMSAFVDQPVPGTAGAFLADRAAEGQAWMDAHENGNPADVVSDTPKTKTKSANATGNKEARTTTNTKVYDQITFGQAQIEGTGDGVTYTTVDGKTVKLTATTSPDLTPTVKAEICHQNQRCIEVTFELGKPRTVKDLTHPIDALVNIIEQKMTKRLKNDEPFNPDGVIRQDDPDAPPPADPDDVPPPPERGDVDPMPGGTTPKKGELPPDPGNPPQDNGVIDPPDQVKGGNSDALPITPLPEDDVFGGTINPGPGDA